MEAIQSSPRRLIAIVSSMWIGHIPSYHRLLVERAGAIGCDVVSISPSGCDGAALYADYKWPGVGVSDNMTGFVCADSLTHHGIFGRLTFRLIRRTGIYAAIRARRNWIRLSSVLREVERDQRRAIDFVFIVYLGNEFVTAGVSCRFVEKQVSWWWGGIWNGPNPGRKWLSLPISGVTPSEDSLRSRSSRTVWTPHRSLTELLREYHLSARIETMPEIADLRSPDLECPSVRRVLQAAAGRRIVGVYGAISLRKGIAMIVEMAKLAARSAPDLFFVVAGEFSSATCGREYEKIVGMTASVGENFLFLPGNIPDGPEFNGHILSLDIVFAVYKDFPFQSNLLTKAAHFRKPVLVAPGGAMAECVEAYELGSIVPFGDSRAALSAVRSHLGGATVEGRAWCPRFAEYAELNDICLVDELLLHAISSGGDL